MSEASHRNHRYDPLDCSQLGPDEVQKTLRELVQVLYSAQNDQISDLFLNIRSGGLRLRRFDRILVKSGEALAVLGQESTRAAEVKRDSWSWRCIGAEVLCIMLALARGKVIK
jgi:hypothetical protein